MDFNDLLALAPSYGRDDAFWYQGDFNYDGKVSFADLLKLGQSYGKQISSVTGAATAASQPLRRR